MGDRIRDLVYSSNISDNDKYYWGYMYDLGRIHIVPYLIKNGAFKTGFTVAEIGSAEGGVLHALADKGAKNCLGTDIAKSRLEMGKTITEIAGLEVSYVYHNIITEPPRSEWIGSFDLAILRDVIEHLDDPQIALENIKKIIKPGGFLYVTFPPYNSPYGGHQHTVAGKLPSKLPYIHLLPRNIFQKLISSGRPGDIGEVERLLDIRLSPEKFVNAANNAGFIIDKTDYYFLRPVFKMKFGLPTIRINGLSSIKTIRNYFCLEAAYLLRKAN